MILLQRSYLLQAISGVFIFLFVYTACSKLLSPAAFRAVLGQSPLLKEQVPFWSLAIPAAEITVALLLVFGGKRRAGMYGALVLMGLFTGYIVFMLAAAPHLPCSCGGVVSTLSWKQHLLLNGALAALAAWGCILSRRPYYHHPKKSITDPAGTAGPHSIAQ
jgi:uncharacterized membrane protein YphA (DoxX/SURF4 family)